MSWKLLELFFSDISSVFDKLNSCDAVFIADDYNPKTCLALQEDIYISAFGRYGKGEVNDKHLFSNISMSMSPHGRGNKSYGFLSTLFAKGEGLVLVKELRISLRNLKDYTYKIQKILTKMHLILTHFESF